MKHKVRLVETRNGCCPFERQSRYDVLLNGEKVEQLFFNLTGYCGTLPIPGGRKLCIGERGISEYRRTVAAINRGEFA